jgi:hypothetical protein
MEGEGQLGLTDHHQIQIRELLRYSRFKRSERLIGIELCFQDFIETRLYEEETYTQDEVRFPYTSVLILSLLLIKLTFIRNN